LTGYKFAQAWIASQEQGNRLRTLQGGWLGEMRDHIRKGIWLSMDIPNQQIEMTGIRKLCCSFGAKEEWDQHIAGLESNSPPQSFIDVLPRMQDTIRRGNLAGTPCHMEEELINGSIITRCKLSVKGTKGFAASIYLNPNGMTEVWGTFNGVFGGENGQWSLNSSNVLSIWGAKLGRFTGPVYQFKDGFKVVGTWSNGTQETISFLCIRIRPD
jgi:hypothetical protein